MYLRAAENITCSQASLFSLETAAAEIDRVLTDCIVKARPAYLMLPTDIAFAKISSAPLATPLSRLPAPNDEEVEADAINQIVEAIKAAGDKSVVLVDACAIRHGVRHEVADFVKKTGIAVFAAPLGKTAVDPEYKNYGGVSEVLQRFMP